MAADAPFLANASLTASGFRPAVSRSPAAAASTWGAVPRPVLRILGTLHQLLYRASGGRLGATVQGGPVLLLTTTGRVSGRPRTWPVCCLPAGDDLVLAASAGGAPGHPGWYLNLRADPWVVVRLANRTRVMSASTVEGAERAQLWKRLVRQYPVCAGYQRNSGRMIPVVVLTPLPCGNTITAPSNAAGGDTHDRWD